MGLNRGKRTGFCVKTGIPLRNNAHRQKSILLAMTRRSSVIARARRARGNLPLKWEQVKCWVLG